MVLLLLLVGLVVAVWPTPVLRMAGHRPAVSPQVVRAGGVTLAVLALMTALLIG